MSQNNSLVSVIMPAYNAAQFIEDAISSVLSQTYTNWELIIINDGSKDRTEYIILSYSDPRIRYFKQDNQGVSVARNLGLNKMRGDFFCFLDADDIFTSNSILSRIEIFKMYDTVNFVDGCVEVFDCNSCEVIRNYAPTFEGNPFQELISLSGKCFFGITWMFRRVAQKYQFKRGMTHSEDLLFYIENSQSGIYRATDEIIYRCRVGYTSAMNDLKRLETGYFQLYNILCSRNIVSNNFKGKIKSIMFKSYISKFEVLSALKVLFR